jgi:two-component system LytT family response regulator
MEMALEKLEKIVSNAQTDSTANIEKLLENFAQNQTENTEKSMTRIASRIGGKVQVLYTDEITHFFAQDKITFAKNSDGKEFPLDLSLNNLEERLDVKTFLRVHRSSIVNMDFIEEVHGWFSGKVLIRLKDKEKTEIVVARNRVKVLKDKLGI